jgi:hypothetical protein
VRRKMRRWRRKSEGGRRRDEEEEMEEYQEYHTLLKPTTEGSNESSYVITDLSLAFTTSHLLNSEI